MEPCDKAARDILADIEAAYRPSQDFVNVDPTLFRHLDLRWYDRTSRLLQSKTFEPMANVADRAAATRPGATLMPVLLRMLLSKDGTVIVTLSHARMRNPLTRLFVWLLRQSPGRVVDMETECTDGSFVVTSNAARGHVADLPPGIAAEFLRPSATVHEVSHRHAARVLAHLAARPGVVARAASTRGEAFASQHRMDALKAAHRGELNGITREMLQRLSVRDMSHGAQTTTSAAPHRTEVRRAS
jgi:hypothetical protein